MWPLQDNVSMVSTVGFPEHSNGNSLGSPHSSTSFGRDVNLNYEVTSRM